MKINQTDTLFKTHPRFIKALDTYSTNSLILSEKSVAGSGRSYARKMNRVGRLYDWIYDESTTVLKNNNNQFVIENSEVGIFLCDLNTFEVKCSQADATLGGINFKDGYIAYTLSRIIENNKSYMTDEIRQERIDLLSEATRENGVIFCENIYYSTLKHEPDIFDKLDYSEITLDEMVRFVNDSANEFSIIAKNEELPFTKFLREESSNFKIKKKRAKRTSKTPKKESSFLDDIKAKKYFVNYPWDEKLADYIIPMSFLDKFEITEEFKEIVKKIKYHFDKVLERMDLGMEGAKAIGNDVINIIIVGKPGTGKTTLCYALSAATGIPICTTKWSKYSDEDEFEGKTKIVEGKPTFVQTDALMFHELGGINVNEEINLADPSVTMGVLGQQLEYPYIVKKNGYETVVRHPLNIQIATMNVGTNGSQPLNQALANRFSASFMMDDPSDKTFVSILEKSSEADSKTCNWVYDAYKKVINYLNSPEVNEEEIVNYLSIRSCLSAISNMEEGQSCKRALINSIVSTIASVDLTIARNVQAEVINILPEL